MSYPTVSVVIPCFNQARYVREAIESVLTQTEPPQEIIVIDDGSTDATLSLLKAFGRSIQVIAQANGGVAAARNVGIAASKGDYVALLDSDDAWLPDKLAAQMRLAARWPDAVLLHTLCSTMDKNSLPRRDSAEEYPDRIEVDALERLLGHCYPTTSSCIIRRSALELVGGFDVAFERQGGYAAEDWELYVRLAEVGAFASVGKPLTKYRVHSESKTQADRLPHTLGLIALRQKIDSRKGLWIATRNTPGLRIALALHTRSLAHLWGRLGLIYEQRSEHLLACKSYSETIRLEPCVPKHRLRYLRALANSARQSPAEGASRS